MPIWGFAAGMAAMGFGLGIAASVTLSLTVIASPEAARGTAISLRLTANRVGQFLIPLGAGVLAGGLGIGSVFLVIALSLSGSCVMAAAKCNGPGE